MSDDALEQSLTSSENQSKSISIKGMYEDWFLDYASYVILDRAVPAIEDGLKPVQRRILHSMKELDDGRYNKVANIIGNTMKYHPHGDASIGDALVQLGQKDYLVDCQGNWGNILTGDGAAAPRYIEARLSKFALETVFNPKTTEWKLSYDGRNKEPVALPVKFPLLLAQGVEGIAVGLACKMLPHNFLELIDASIKILKNEDFDIYPDFPTGGFMDCARYNEGLRGGKVLVRAKIQQIDKKTLAITEIPFGTTTSNLIESIASANDKGKIKIKKIDDNTAADVEILIHLASGVSPDQTIDALYAFTDCQSSISPNACVILDDKPHFLSVKDILRYNTQNTTNLLKKELEIELSELEEKWHWVSLERIFIENEIYEHIKKCTTDESINQTIDEGLKPFVKSLIRPVVLDDILRLRKIPIDRIAKYNSDKATDIILAIEDDIKQVKYDLEHLIDFAIAYFERIKTKYGKGRERKTEIRNFENIEAVSVAVANEKLYVNYKEGFAGYGLKKDEYVCDCSDIDDIIIFRQDGTFMVTKVSEKGFVGESIIHIDVFRKNDERTIYNMAYQDGVFGHIMVKRFAVTSITRDKPYDLTKGTKGTKVLYFSANPNGEAETVTVYHKPKPKLKKLNFDFDFASIAIKGRGSMGNILTRNAVRKISQKGEGVSTLGARKIWFDETVKRLNAEERGTFIGEFKGSDKILTITKSGGIRLYNFDLSNHFDDDLLIIRKYNPQKVVSAVYIDGETLKYYLKRFLVEDTDKKVSLLDEHPETQLISLSLNNTPKVIVVFDKDVNGKHLDNEEIIAEEFIGTKSYKAKGKRISNYAVKEVQWIEPEEIEEIVEEEPEETLPPIELDDHNDHDSDPQDIIQGTLF